MKITVNIENVHLHQSTKDEKEVESVVMWLARDRNCQIYMFKEKPEKKKDVYAITKDSYLTKLPRQLFPSVTWENSPKKVKLSLID